MCSKEEHFTRALQRGQATIIESSAQRDEFAREISRGRIGDNSRCDRYFDIATREFVSKEKMLSCGEDADHLTEGRRSYLLRSLAA